MISSGEGSDIIIFSPNEYSDLKDLIQEGLLCDLNELIKKDKSFKLTDYNEKVMDCGAINGKRYFFPISFYIPALFTTKHAIDFNPEKWDWESIAATVKKFIEDNEGQQKYELITLLKTYKGEDTLIKLYHCITGMFEDNKPDRELLQEGLMNKFITKYLA